MRLKRNFQTIMMLEKVDKYRLMLVSNRLSKVRLSEYLFVRENIIKIFEKK